MEITKVIKGEKLIKGLTRKEYNKLHYEKNKQQYSERQKKYRNRKRELEAELKRKIKELENSILDLDIENDQQERKEILTEYQPNYLYLGVDIWFVILQNMSINQVIKCRLVSKLLNQVSDHPLIWSGYLSKIYTTIPSFNICYGIRKLTFNVYKLIKYMSQVEIFGRPLIIHSILFQYVNETCIQIRHPQFTNYVKSLMVDTITLSELNSKIRRYLYKSNRFCLECNNSEKIQRYEVKKETPNKGRIFYIHDRCGLFEWEDGQPSK